MKVRKTAVSWSVEAKRSVSLQMELVRERRTVASFGCGAKKRLGMQTLVLQKVRLFFASRIGLNLSQPRKHRQGTETYLAGQSAQAHPLLNACGLLGCAGARSTKQLQLLGESASADLYSPHAP